VKKGIAVGEKQLFYKILINGLQYYREKMLNQTVEKYEIIYQKRSKAI